MNIKLRKILLSSQLSRQEAYESESELCEEEIVDLPVLQSISARQHYPIKSRFRLLSLDPPKKRRQALIKRNDLTEKRKKCLTIQKEVSDISHEAYQRPYSRNKKNSFWKEKLKSEGQMQANKETLNSQLKKSIEFEQMTLLRKTQKCLYALKSQRRSLITRYKGQEEQKEDVADEVSSNQEDIIRFLPAIKRHKKGNNLRKSNLINGISLKKMVQDNLKRQILVFSLKKFKKCVNAILFTIYLKDFNRKMRAYHKQSFQVYLKNNLIMTLQRLKQLLIIFSQPFFDSVREYEEFDFRLYINEDQILFREKVKVIKKLLKLQLQCLKKGINTITNEELYCQLLYHLCRHGSYSCLNSIYTAEELNYLCISDQWGYLQGNKILEKSALVLLVLIKMVVYNIFLEPQALNYEVRKSFKAVNNNNIKFIGNSLYALFVHFHDQLIQSLQLNYKIGNWTQLIHTFDIKVADSMTAKEGYYLEGELISGLSSRNYIEKSVGVEFMNQSKIKTKEILGHLHSMISLHHRKARSIFFNS